MSILLREICARSACAIIIISLVACSGDNTSADDSDASQQLLQNFSNSIIGEWFFLYPDTQCKETYRFGSDGSISATSLDEIQSGVYQLTNDGDDLIRLTISPMMDNLGSDCRGNNFDSTTINFVFIISFPGADEMAWANPSEPNTVVLILSRQP